MGVYFVTLVLFGLAVSSIAERVTLTQINLDKSDHAAREKRSSRFMPNKIYYRLEDEKGLYVVLHLTKLDLPPTTIIKNGKSVEFFATSENVATYQDFNRDGVFMLGLRWDSNGEFDYEMIGTFQFGKRRVVIYPHPNIRTAYNVEDDDGIVDYRGDSLYPPDFVPVRKPTRQSRALTNYIIEVCFLADYAIYQKFLTKNANDVTATQTEMSTYYAFHAEQLRVRYKMVQEVDPSFSITIVNTGLVIFTDPADIAFVETNKVGDTINSSLILSEFRSYINNIPAGITIPDSDHYMLFSGYDLFSASSGSLSNAGLAYTGVLCTTYAMSLVEDRRRERSAITAAHELAHGVGARHDTDEGCDNADQYIMTAVSNIGAITSTEIAKRRWTFSSCSVAAFKRDLENTDCLFDNRYGDGELSASPKLGQIYSKDDQCRFAVADNSSYFGEAAGEDCYKMRCVLSQTSGGGSSYRFVLPLDYSDCGTDMWCVHGECVAKPASEPAVNQAPSITNLPTTHDVAENENGVVFSMISSDPEGNPISYSYRWNSPNNADTYFDINTQTGAVSVKPGVTLDYATLQNTVFNVTVTATDDQGGASPSENLILRITQVAASNNPPVIINTGTSVQIPESIPTTQTILDIDATDADPGDNPTFTANWVNPANGGNFFDFDSTTGVITKKPGATLIGGQTYTVEVTANDGKDSSAPRTFDINVIADVNTPPTITNPVNSGPATVTLTSLTQTGQIFDFDAVDNENDPFSFQVANWSPANGATYFDLNPNDGTVSIKPGVTLPPSTTFTLQVTATDSKSATSQPATLVITTPAAVNQPPTLTNPPNSGTEVVQLTSLTPTGTIFDFDGTDPEGVPVQYIVDSFDPNDALLYFNVDITTGAVTRTGTPLPPSTTFTLNVKVSDGTLNSTPGTVIIQTPNAVNQPPTLTNPLNSGTEFVQLTSLTPTGTIFDFDGTDPEGVPVQYIVDSSTPNNALTYFSVNPTSGEVSRTNVPLPPSTTFTLKVKVSDGNLESAPGTLIITTPAAPNDAPVIINPTQAAPIQTTTTGEIGGFFAIDPNGDPLTYVVDSWNPGSGSQLFYLNPQTGKVTVKPGAVLPPGSTYTLKVKASDGTDFSNIGTLVIEVEQPANDPPAFAVPSYTVTIPVNKVGAVVTVTANDPNPGDTVSYSVSSWNPIDGTNYFVINPTTGVISVRPGVTLPPNQVFVADVAASDGNLSGIAKVTITTTQAPNTAPVITNLDDVKIVSTSDPAGIIFTVSSRDDQNDVVTYTGTWDNSIAANILSFNSQTGEVSLKSTPFLQLYLNNQYTLTVTASDGQLTSVPKTLTVRITQNSNSPPRITNLPDTVTIQENPAGAKFFTVQATDPENNNIVFSGTWEPSWAQYYFDFNENTGEVSSKPGPNIPNLVFKLKVTAADLYGTSSTETLSVIIGPSNTNDPPTFLNLPAKKQIPNSQQSGVTIFDVNAQDPEGSSLTYSITNKNLFPQFLFQIDPSSGIVSLGNVYSIQNFPPQDVDLMISVSDGSQSTEKTLTLSIGPNNEPPVFNSTFFIETVDEGPVGTVVFNAGLATDPNGDPITYQLEGSPANGFTIDQSTGVIRYSEDYYISSGRPTRVLLTVSASDPGGLKGIARLLLTIRQATTAPLKITNLPHFQILNRFGTYNVIYKVEASGGRDPKTFQLDNDAGVFNINSSTGEITLKPGITLTQFGQGNHQNYLRVIVTDSANKRVEGALTVVVF